MPIADTGGPYSENIDKEILFNGSDSYDPDGIIVLYEWDFGDGAKGLGETTTHAYRHPGDYTVILTVTDNDGATDNDITIAYINGPPSSPMIDGKTNGEAGTEYEYIFVSSDMENDPLFYFIDWGDGNTEEWIGPYYDGEWAKKNHTWNKSGKYEIKAKAKDIWDAESGWSTLEVKIPMTQEVINGCFPIRFLEQYSQAFMIIKANSWNKKVH